MSGRELTKVLFWVVVGVLLGLCLGWAVDPLPPQTALVAAGAEGADERNRQAEQLVDRMEKIDEQRRGAEGEAVEKLNQEFAEVDRKLAAVWENNAQYRKELEAHNEAASSPERRRHFILYGAGGSVIGLLTGLALLALDRGRRPPPS